MAQILILRIEDLHEFILFLEVMGVETKGLYVSFFAS